MKKKIVTLLLAALMLLACVSCADQPTTPAEEQTEETEKPSVIVEGPTSDFVLFGGEAYTIVMPVQDVYGETSQALELKKALGGTMDLRADRQLSDADRAEDGRVVIIGKCEDPLVEKAAAMLEHPKDYVIFTEKNKIVVYSEDVMQLDAAMKDLLSTLKEVDGKQVVSLAEKKYVYYKYPAVKMKLGDVLLSDYTIVLPDESEKAEPKAEAINAWMLENIGITLPVKHASDPETANEILIGNTGRAADTVSATLEENSYRVELIGTKVILVWNGYANGAEDAFLAALTGEKVDTLSLSQTIDGMGVFREDNFAAVYVTKRRQSISAETLDNASPGVLALLSNCMYYESELQKGLERGELWVYSNSSTWVPQNGFFDDMVKSGKTGTNCAMPQAWALIDLGVVKNGGHMYGKTDGALANMAKAGVGTAAAAACDLVSWSGRYPFSTLYQNGLIEPGDIFFAKGHTFIYMGDELFMAAGHDGKWHSVSNAPTEDGQKACFETWVCDMKSNTDYNYSIWWQMRFKEDYIPEYYRNAEGERVKCPIWNESCALTEQDFQPTIGKLK